MTDTLKLFRKAYFIGIGGSGMSNLAMLLKSAGCEVRGSDAVNSATIQALEKLDIAVSFNQSGEDFAEDASIVIKSAAIKDAHPEILKARRFNIPIVKYARAISLLMREKLGIAIAGTHGKTTTSSLLAEIFHRAKKHPAFLIGGVPSNLEVGGRWDVGNHFIVEACEYDRSFLEFNPVCVAITNIEAEHLDYYRDLAEIEEAFAELVSKVPARGKIFINADDASSLKMQAFAKAPVKTFGFSEFADYRAEIISEAQGAYKFRVVNADFISPEIQPVLSGMHIVKNALLCFAVAHSYGLDMDAIKWAIENFKGSKRRFEFKGFAGNIPVYDDYAHHPTELKALIEAAKAKFADKKLTFVFQPHQAFRTRKFFFQFAEVLSKTHRVILTPIFAARENSPVANLSLIKRLEAQINKLAGNALFISDFENIANYLEENCSATDVIFTVGAGDIYRVAENLISKNLRKKSA